MKFRDQRLECSVCGRSFIYTVTEQRERYQQAQQDGEPEPGTITAPTECPSCRTRDPETGRWTGRVKWFSQDKGYGFIVKPDGSEIFFHRSQVDEAIQEVNEGAAVSFEQVDTDRGPEAQHVDIES
jgi:CspA family cold shock protein